MIWYRAANASDLPAVCELLAEAGLVALDESSQFGPQYVVAIDDKRVVGVAGLEVYGESALLRSVVVREGERSRGIGEKLTANRVSGCGRMAFGSCTC